MYHVRIATAIINFFVWHPVVRDYLLQYFTINYGKPGGRKEHKQYADEVIGKPMEYIKSHGNSIWAKIEWYVVRVKIWIFIVAVIVLLALMAGWRP